MSSKPQHVLHDQTWSKQLGGHCYATSISLIHTHYHLRACDILNKNIFFSSQLPWKTIILNVIITIVHLESKNVRNIPFWCLKETIKFQMLNEDNVMNLSITWCRLAPFKTSISPFPSSFNRCLERKKLLATNTMVDGVAHGVWDIFSLTRDLTYTTISLEWPFTTKWSYIPKWITTRVKFSYLCMT